jgi:hypothetical protein
VHDAIIARTKDQNLEMLGNGKPRWAVFVIDEIQSAAKHEQIVRDKLEGYMNKVGKNPVYEVTTNNKGETKEKKIGIISEPRYWSRDPAYLFCAQWLDWADRICPSWVDIATKYLRNSSSTLITIFQDNGWLNLDDSGNGRTRIGRMMIQLSKKTYKVVGKGALAASNKWGDPKIEAKSKSPSDQWYLKEISEKSKWAIGENEGIISDTSPIFKPFQVFTTDLGYDKKVTPDDYGAGADSCYKTKEDKLNGNGKKPTGLQSYMNYLFNGLQDEINNQVNNGERLPGTETPQGVLQTSFEYLNSISKNGILNDIYRINPIEQFSGSVSSEEAETMAQRAQRAQTAQDQLDSLNSDLPNSTAEDYSQPTGNYPNQGYQEQQQKLTDQEITNIIVPLVDAEAKRRGLVLDRETRRNIIQAIGNYMRRAGY